MCEVEIIVSIIRVYKQCIQPKMCCLEYQCFQSKEKLYCTRTHPQHPALTELKYILLI